jgi:8-oxo-dGTP pyrophosphatase MutT (NUDIX family)
MHNTPEMIYVVDDDNNVIGTVSQEEIYSKKLTHRILHVFVLHPKTGQVYFQKRSETKSYLPGFYCTSAGGHVRSGESFEDAARRELCEELGIRIPIKKVHECTFILDNHKRFIELFIGFAEGGFNFSDKEVSSGFFLILKTLQNSCKKGRKSIPACCLLQLALQQQRMP